MLQDHPTIMVVDDDEGMRVTLEGIIEDEGYNVIVAEDGYRAIELTKENPCALFFMDIRMPGINGVETYREIKKASPGSVVAMMTGFTAEILVQAALDEGAYTVVYKPFRIERIIQIVNTVIKSSGPWPGSPVVTD